MVIISQAFPLRELQTFIQIMKYCGKENIYTHIELLKTVSNSYIYTRESEVSLHHATYFIWLGRNGDT